MLGINTAGVNDAIGTYVAAGNSCLQYLGDGCWQFNGKTLKDWAVSNRTFTLYIDPIRPSYFNK